MHSILVATEFLSAPGAAALGEAETHHLRDVLRARVGDEVRLLDGRGSADFFERAGLLEGLHDGHGVDAGAVAEAALRHEAEERHDLALASALLAFGATRDETIRAKVAHLLEETQP